MLAGRPPFEAENPAALLCAIMSRAPRPLAELCPEVPRHLAELVARTLAKSPADRFESMAALPWLSLTLPLICAVPCWARSGPPPSSRKANTVSAPAAPNTLRMAASVEVTRRGGYPRAGDGAQWVSP